MRSNPSENVSLAPWLEAIDALSAWFDVLDVSAIDGFLAALCLQPRPIDESRWWPLVLGLESDLGEADAQGLRLAQNTLLPKLRARLAELGRAIEARSWFDPWVLTAADEDDRDALEDTTTVTRAIQPWVDGFALALEHFDDFSSIEPTSSVNEALALIYAHVEPGDLDDPGLQEAIEELEPAQSMQEAVEDLVSACLLLADLTEPVRSRAKKAAARPRDVESLRLAVRGLPARYPLPRRRKANPTKIG